MTIRAGCCHMPPGELEPCLFMFRQAERRGAVTFQVVTLLASIEVGSCGELTLVLIFVAVRTLRKLKTVECVLALRYVTLRAVDCGVLLQQRVRRARMFLHPVGRRLETLNAVARRTFSFVSALNELSVVLVPVTVRAFLECQGFLKVAASVAAQTIDCLMLAFQRVFGFGVIELLAYRLQRDLFPSARVMA